MIEPQQQSSDQMADGSFLAQLGVRLRAALGFSLAQAAPIFTGYANNNLLYRLRAADGRRAIAKRYYPDERRRLDREFGTLRFLHKRGMRRIATPLLRCDDLDAAVYSDEPGATVSAPELTTTHLRELGRFVAELHSVTLAEPGAGFPPSVAATFSYAEKVAAIRRRPRLFAEASSAADAPVAVRDLCAERDVVGEIERLLTRAVADLGAEARVAAIPEAAWRLDSGDFAPHNVLARPDGSVCVLDFEYAGWNRPLATLAAFLTAATALDLRREQVAAFLGAYRQAAGLSADDFTALPRLCALDHLFWCGVHLSITTPTHLARKRFANPNLDADAVIAEQLAAFRRRLALAERAVGELEGANR